MGDRVTCFVLAAGLGERLRPITSVLPKPLLPLLGRPILQQVLERVSALPVGGIGVNLHYKGETIAAWLKESAFSERVTLFPEEPILDTGGALKNAEAFLGGGPFIVHNADILTDLDLERLLAHHLSSSNLATLAVHDCPQFNHVALDKAGFVAGVGKGAPPTPQEARRVAFTGVAVYSPEFLKFLPEGASGVVAAWLRAAAAGHKIGVFDAAGCLWSDIGTPAAYAAALVNMLKSDGELVYVHPSAAGCGAAALNGYVVAEQGAVLGNGVSLNNCIVLPHTAPEAGAYENCIIGPGFTVPVSEAAAGLADREGRVLIGVGGSDRKYFRVRQAGRTEVLMQCLPGDQDYRRHLEYTEFFRSLGVPVPELRAADPETWQARFEDLGDLSLYGWSACTRSEAQTEELYRKALDIAVLLHTGVTRRAAECPLLFERVFDYDHLRWETSYFMERFVAGLKGAGHRDMSALNEEFHRLALRVDGLPKTVMHRDFQSQNIMVAASGMPRLIDYQGARRGPSAYDVVSLLWDPYRPLGDDLRARLVAYYTAERAAREERFDGGAFGTMLLLCRLQRHMQALGAYGFLATVKGKRYFLKHVPECLRLLKEEAALVKAEYPELCELVEKIW